MAASAVRRRSCRGLQTSVFAVQGRSSAFLAWVPPAQPLAVDHSGPPVLLSLLLSAACPALAHVGKITLVIVSL
jgi:hypothetical protein